MKDWPTNYEPDYGDIESGYLNRGFIPVTETTFFDNTYGWLRAQRTRILRQCGETGHPVDEDDEYGNQIARCRECRDECARDRAVNQRIDEAIERRHFGD